LLVDDDDDNDDDDESTANKPRSVVAKKMLKKKLIAFRDLWLEEAEKLKYARSHSTLGIFGALAFLSNTHTISKSPVSPAAWLVVSALNDSGAGLHVTDRAALETRVEDFLRDYRFEEKDTVRLRPGWKFLPPVIMRESTR